MIKSYSDHAANERTFLAWLRTGLSIVAFGFVIERLNLFIAELGQIIPSHAGPAGRVAGLIGRVGRNEGFIFTAIGAALIVVGSVHFVRTAREIDRAELRPASGPRAELLISGVLVLLASAYWVYLALQ
jgi:putative membrane protein